MTRLPTEVRLSTSELAFGAHVGIWRRLASLKRGQTNKVNNLDFGWHTDIEAALAELAASKYLQTYWGGSVNTFKLPDVGVVQVRHTRHLNGSLILRSADSSDELFLLVVGTSPVLYICGWIVGRDGKDAKYLNARSEGYPAFFVPQSKLNPPNSLNPRLRSEKTGELARETATIAPCASPSETPTEQDGADLVNQQQDDTVLRTSGATPPALPSGGSVATAPEPQPTSTIA